MRVNHQHPIGTPNRGILQETKEANVDVSNIGARFGYPRLLIKADVHERFVEWPSDAMRRMGISLDAHARLEALVTSSIYACQSGKGGLFVCRAVDAKGSTPDSKRHLFQIHKTIDNRWIIKE